MIDLALTNEQERLRESFAALFEKEAGIDLVREVEGLGFSPRLWKQVVALGAIDMAVPEASGGGGAGLVEAVLVAELAGRHLAPVPLVETVTANRLLATISADLDAPDGLAADVLLRALQSGAVTTVSVGQARSGQLRWVPAGAVAEVVLFFDGDGIAMVGGSGSGQNEPNLGSLPVAHRMIDGARRLASGGEAERVWRRALDDWRILTAAWLNGAGRRSLELALAYTDQRKAFGVPIASYQTVAHRLADAATALDGAELLHRKAAWATDTESARAHELALMAFSFAEETAEASATDALHFHGGYGFMLEYDIQLYLRRIKAVALQAGPQSGHLRSLADQLWLNNSDRPQPVN